MALDSTGDIPTTYLGPAASTKQLLCVSSKCCGAVRDFAVAVGKKDMVLYWFCRFESS